MTIHDCKECNALEVNGNPVYRGAWLIQSDNLEQDLEISVGVDLVCYASLSDGEWCSAMVLTPDHLRSLREMCTRALRTMGEVDE